ncbi:hypothetical protein BOBR111200_20665 [Bordetella bronchialis]
MAPVAWPLISGLSFVPSMVIVTSVGVPSAVSTVIFSVRLSPTPSSWTLGSLLFRL